MFRRRFKPFRRVRKQNVNETIRAREVRVVFPDGKTEVLPTPVGVRKAKDLGLDLVVVSPTADPPVAKVIDYGEYTYQEKKKKNEAKRKQHKTEIKEVKFRPNTDDHDYEFKKNHARRFLEEGNKVKGTVFFRGREITHADLGDKLLKRLAEDIADLGHIEVAPRLDGRMMHAIFGPSKKALKKAQEAAEAQAEEAARRRLAAKADGAEEEEEIEEDEDFDENGEEFDDDEDASDDDDASDEEDASDDDEDSERS